MAKFIKVAKKSEIAEQSAKCVEIGDKRIAVFNLAGEFYAIDDACTHFGGSLSEGTIHGDEVECPLHSAYFNIKTGEVTYPPAHKNVKKYNVRVIGEDIEIEL